MTSGPMGESSVEALINLATGKHFILLEEGVVLGRVKVINPEGQILQVTDRIFEPDPIQVSREEFEKFFTAAQLQSLKQYDDDSAMRLQREMEERSQAAEEPTRERSAPRSPKRSGQTRTPVGAQRIVTHWSSSQFTLYKHKIEPLKPNEQFCVSVEGEGDYVISKAEFLKFFNNVVMDQMYRSQGIYKSSPTPEAALPFLRNKG